MRALGLIAVALSLTACLGSEQPCSSRPTDPMCNTVDGGPRPDGGGDGGGGDAHVACGGTCTGTMSHCLVSGTSETCVGCVAEGDCTGGLHCDMTSHACVECTTMAQCTDVGMSRCDTTAHTCGACTVNGDCTHLTGTTVCDTAAGSCVQCSATDQTACTSGICLTGTGTCAPMGGATSTCGACTHDADCHAGQLCIPMTHSSTVVGNFCAWRLDAAGLGAPGGDCLANARPYTRPTMVTSVDGVSTMVCTLRSTTCEALSNFLSACTPATAPASSTMCGSHMDGFCVHEGSMTACTTECVTNEDCKCTGGSCANQYVCTSGFCDLSTQCTWNSGTRRCI